MVSVEHNRDPFQEATMSLSLEQNDTLLKHRESKQQLSSKPHPSQSFRLNGNTLYVFLLLLFIVSGAMFIVITRSSISKRVITNNDNQELLNNWSLNDDASVNDKNGDPQLRAGSYYKTMKGPRELGHMNIYVFKSGITGNRQRPIKYRFPVACYNDHQFPLNGPFVSFIHEIPILADRSSRQTIISSINDDICILPPLINIHDEAYSVAQLIASRYASFVPSGARPTKHIDMRDYFRPEPLYGHTIPRISSSKGDFIGGVDTDLDSFFITKLPSRLVSLHGSSEEEQEYYDRPATYSRNKYYKRPLHRHNRDTTTAINRSTKKYTVPNIKWEQCTDEAFDGTQVECGFLSLPLDYTRPHHSQIKIAVSRLKHTVTDDKYQGIMLVNPGGPGGPGLSLINFFAQALPSDVVEAYDLIGFDPRGVGASEPALSCLPYYMAGPRPNYVPSTENLEDIWQNRSKSYAMACAEKHAKLLPHMTTIDTVKDMDNIRISLKQEQINFYGFSYGTYLGQVYSTLFPKRVRRMVLDANVDPRNIYFEANINQDLAFDRNIRIWFRWLAQYSSVFGLGSTEGEVAYQYDKAQKELETNPANGIIGPDEWTDIFLYVGYAQSLWIVCGTAFSQWVQNQDFGLLVSLYENLLTPGDDNGFAVYLAVQCTDIEWPQDWEYVRIRNWRTFSKAPLMTWSNAWYNGPCQYWPAKARTPINIDGSKVGNILLISETLDAATPFEGSLEVRRRFPGARLIAAYNGTTHANTLSNNLCVDNPIIEYLKTGAVPPRHGGDTPDVCCEALPEPVIDMSNTLRTTAKTEKLSKKHLPHHLRHRKHMNV